MDAINAYLDGLATKLDNIRTSCNAILTDAGFSPAQTLYDLPAAIDAALNPPTPVEPDPQEEPIEE